MSRKFEIFKEENFYDRLAIIAGEEMEVKKIAKRILDNNSK